MFFHTLSVIDCLCQSVPMVFVKTFTHFPSDIADRACCDARYVLLCTDTTLIIIVVVVVCGLILIAVIVVVIVIVIRRYSQFSPRCMEFRRGLAMRILSICPSVKRVHCGKTEKTSSSAIAERPRCRVG